MEANKKIQLTYLCYLESTGGPFCCINRSYVDKWKGTERGSSSTSDYDQLIESVSDEIFPNHLHPEIGRFRVFNSETGNLLVFRGENGHLAILEMIYSENWAIPWNGLELDISNDILNLGEAFYNGIGIFDSSINIEQMNNENLAELIFKSDKDLAYFDGFFTNQIFDRFSIVDYQNKDVFLNGVLLFPLISSPSALGG